MLKKIKNLLVSRKITKVSFLIGDMFDHFGQLYGRVCVLVAGNIADHFQSKKAEEAIAAVSEFVVNNEDTLTTVIDGIAKLLPELKKLADDKRVDDFLTPIFKPVDNLWTNKQVNEAIGEDLADSIKETATQISEELK